MEILPQYLRSKTIGFKQQELLKEKASDPHGLASKEQKQRQALGTLDNTKKLNQFSDL